MILRLPRVVNLCITWALVWFWAPVWFYVLLHGLLYQMGNITRIRPNITRGFGCPRGFKCPSGISTISHEGWGIPELQTENLEGYWYFMRGRRNISSPRGFLSATREFPTPSEILAGSVLNIALLIQWSHVITLVSNERSVLNIVLKNKNNKHYPPPLRAFSDSKQIFFCAPL